MPMNINVERVDGKEGFTVPGFTANGVYAGIKEDPKSDLALIFSETPATAAGVFTTGTLKAAPVLLSMERVKGGKAQAILVNSGNANAATGEQGYRDAVDAAAAAASLLGIDERLVLTASTGIIGRRLPVGKIKKAMKRLVEGLRTSGLSAAEEGIMTTDRFPKMALRKTVIDGRTVTVCGLAKGAGMIEPKMATMLSFLLTDAAVDRRSLAGCLRRATEKSFNAITVDGCMSTNDTVIILANGRAGNRTLRAGSDGLLRFDEAVLSVVTELATAIVRDGEGATKIIELTVEGAGSAGDAKKIAFAVGRSNLVKTAFFGKDPNWGRVYAAVGASGVPVKEEELEIYFGGIPIFKRGRGIEKADRPLLEVMERDSVAVLVRVGSGPGSFTVFAADLTHDYVTINAHYHT